MSYAVLRRKLSDSPLFYIDEKDTVYTTRTEAHLAATKFCGEQLGHAAYVVRLEMMFSSKLSVETRECE